MRQEVVIAGFTAPRNSRQFFGSLLLGVYQGDDLVYVGHTGSGFNKKSLELVYNKLQPLIINESPFTKKAKANMPVTWVKPKLVCEIKFTEWTKDGIARHPIFMGLRSDKKAREVILEKATTMAGIKSVKQKTAVKQSVKKDSAATSGGLKKKSAIKQGKISGIQLDVASETDQTVVISKQELKLTNLQKPYWKKEGFAKGDMINYYLRMAPYMLPYLLDRPHSLNRHPNGVGQPNFFQKDVRGKVPDWITKHEDFSESTNQPVEYLVCSNEATLIFMANMGCIEINPWHSRTQSWRQPDWCLIDLDPDKGNSFEQVMETALVTKKILDAIGANGYVKTSGSTGIHIYIPLGGRYSFEQSKMMAELIVTLVNKELPELTSTVRNPAKRKGKIYLDFMQNAETQTAAAPYSLRPKPGVPVSTPLDWSELKKGLTQTTWNARNIFDRLQSEGDLFAPVLKKGINLEKVLSKLEGLK
jgi:bifunctional non-homologous end joining protein LigD